MKNKLETWRDIPGYEGLYQVSSLGRVRSLKYRQKDMTRILKQFKDGTYKDRRSQDYGNACIKKFDDYSETSIANRNSTCLLQRRFRVLIR